MYKKVLLFILLFSFGYVNAQDTIQPSVLNKKRFHTLIGVGTGLYVTSMSALYVSWYKGYPQTRFHWADDAREWLLKDKMGHFTTTYQVGNYSYWALRWAGLDEKKAIWIGGTTGLVFMTTIEFFDGLSAQWGASPSDLLANTMGSALFISQQLAWHEQRIRLKFSYHPTQYAQYRPNLLGNDYLQRIIKDYNGETNWLSVNVYSFLHKESKFPKWLNVAVGYGATGMIGAYSNPPYYNGRAMPSFQRLPRFYLSVDVDWTKIKTHSAVLRFVFKAISFIKIPAPALEYNHSNGLLFHPLYF